MPKINSFVINKIEEKLSQAISAKGACAQLRLNLYNSESDNGYFSLNTIKRWFGLIEKQIEPRQNGLEAIATYLNYPSWDALTLDPAYNEDDKKGEDDYIADIYNDYAKLIRSIQDYSSLKEKSKNEYEVAKYESILKKLTQKQQFIKESLFKLSELLTDTSDYQYDWEEIQSLFKGKNYTKANALLNENTLKEEQNRILRSLKKKGKEALAYERLRKNAEAFYIKADIARFHDDLNKCEDYYLYSLKSDRSIKTIYVLAGFYMDNRNYEKALPLYLEILAKKDEILSSNNNSDISYYIFSVYNIGQIYLNQEEYDKGLPIMQSFIRLCQEFNIENKDYWYIQVADAYNEMGNAYYEDNHLDKARELYNESIKLYKDRSYEDYILTSLNLSYLNIDDNQYDKAKTIMDDALVHYMNLFKENKLEKDEYRITIGKIYFLYAYYYEKLHDYDLSIQAYTRASIYFKSSYAEKPVADTKMELYNVYHNLMKIYKKLNNEEKVLECQNLLLEYNPRNLRK